MSIQKGLNTVLWLIAVLKKLTSKQDCEYRQRDEKRRPVSHEYVSSLESRIAWLESLIMRIKEADFQDRETILEAVSFDHHPRQEQEHPLTGMADVDGDTSPLEPKLETDLAGSLICHGPTSIYQVWPNEPLPRDPPTTNLPLGSQTDLEQIAGHFGINLDNEIILETLMLFFKWQYPHFMFIYREAFLRDHYSNCRSACKYWSPSLLLAICALGSLMRPDIDHGQVGGRFYAAAESITLVFGLSQPSITTVQTLLCLSFFEIGRGNSSKGWGLSGMNIN
ncbi:unnamed protein product [Clonostachys byssicola]|uniref:Xylanolytic transcriptional activator regulatory domain-containing protein n=1 Tax=Clonostachys byssicola TaxID=160290 RepID=A0A9N9UTH7_9HYPO|nr:unnamed protein product [Clonostachys byssicola]